MKYPSLHKTAMRKMHRRLFFLFDWKIRLGKQRGWGRHDGERKREKQEEVW